MNKILSTIEGTSLLVSIAIADLKDILNLILIGISIVIGLINLFLIVKKALKDGEIDDEEQAKINKELKKIIKRTDKDE